MNKPPPPEGWNKKRLDVGEDSEPELTNAQLTAMVNSNAEETRALLLEQGGQPVRAAEQNLHHLLQTLLARCQRDPEVMVLLTRFLGKLGNLAGFGNSMDQLSDSKLKELRAALIGGTMVTEGYRSVAPPEIQPRTHAADARRFLDLVEERVGKKGDDGTTTIKMRLSEDQVGGQIKYKKQ